MSRIHPALVGLSALLVAALASAGGSVIPEVGNTPAPARANAIADLDDPKHAAEAVDALVAQGTRGTETLARLATDADDLSVRGRSISGLARARGKLADDTLASLLSDSEPLVRTWAFAAQVARTDSFDALTPLAGTMHAYPGSERAVQLKVESLAGGASAVQLIELTQTMPQLQAAMGSSLLGISSVEYVTVMTTHDNDAVRRTAASYLGAKAQKGEVDDVAGAVVEVYRYDSRAREVPWKGGALYIPGIQWPGEEARELIKSLNAWDSWCLEHGKTQERNQIANNLRSVSLQRAANR